MGHMLIIFSIQRSSSWSLHHDREERKQMDRIR